MPKKYNCRKTSSFQRTIRCFCYEFMFLKMFRAKNLAALGLLIIVGQSSATDEANCRGIDNVLERLACYDESHKENGESQSLEDRKK